MKGSVKLMRKKRFTPEYKEEIIKLVTERKKKMSEVARDIGVTSTSIRRWITQYSEYGKDAFPGKGNLRTEDDKIRKLMRDNIDVEKMRRIHKESYKTYGIRRIKAKLNKEGISCGKNRIARLMRENGVFSRLRRKYKATTNSNHRLPVAPNLLDQDFTADKPNTKWVGDITYIPTDEGFLYFSGIEDLFQRKVVGWSLGDRITKELTIDALEQAVVRENP